MYVEALIGRDTVDTIPPATMDAFRDHGEATPDAIEQDVAGARALLAELEQHGISLKEVTDELVKEGVQQFADAFDKLFGAIAQRRRTLLDGDRAAPRDRAGLAGDEGRLRRGDGSLAQGRAHSAALGRRQDAVDRDGRGQMARLAARRRAGDGRSRPAARLRRGGEAARLHRRRAAGHGRIEPGAGSAGRDLRAADRLAALPHAGQHRSRADQAIEQAIDLGKTLFIVSSKSGSTLEPNIFMDYFFDRVGAVRGKDKAGEHFVAVTDPGSSLERRAKQLGFAHIFYGVPSIGGRYSVLSKFGLVPAAAMGLDVKRLLETTRPMERACGADVPPAENPGVQLGVALGIAATRFGRDKVTIIASPGIADLGAWLEQLLAESTGKQGRGLIPLAGEPLARPSVMAATGSLPIWSWTGERSGAAPGGGGAGAAGHPVARISVTDIWHIGQEFFRWEIATAVAGAIIGIDPFDQPDVEASKVKTRALTEEYEKSQACRKRRRSSARTAWRSTPIRATPASSAGTRHCPAI